MCGVDSAAGSSATYVVYPRTNEDFLLNLQKTDPMHYSFYGVCVQACPSALDLTCNYEVDTSVPAGSSVSCMDVKPRTVSWVRPLRAISPSP